MALKFTEVRVQVELRIAVFSRLPPERLQKLLLDPEAFLARFPEAKTQASYHQDRGVMLSVVKDPQDFRAETWVNDTPEDRSDRSLVL